MVRSVIFTSLSVTKTEKYRGGTMYPWDSAGVLAPLIVGTVFLVPFFYVEKVAALPIIPSESSQVCRRLNTDGLSVHLQGWDGQRHPQRKLLHRLCFLC